MPQLGLKIMGVPANLLSLGAMDFGIIVDGAVIVIETGISAADRARTVQAAVAKNARVDDLVQPGHIFPYNTNKNNTLH